MSEVAGAATVAPAIETRPRIRHRTPATLLAAVGVVVLFGVIAGAVWAVATPGASAVKGRTQVFMVDSIAGVATFAFVMFGFGVVAAIVTWFVASGWRGLPGYAAMLASTVFGGALAGVVGSAFAARRFPNPDSFGVGDVFTAVPQLWLDGVTRGSPSGPWILLICAPLTATVVYLLAAIVSRRGDLGVGDGRIEQSDDAITSVV
ncbi:DUF2567 domain-containing protein [Gordonia sp. NPDC003950]